MNYLERLRLRPAPRSSSRTSIRRSRTATRARKTWPGCRSPSCVSNWRRRRRASARTRRSRRLTRYGYNELPEKKINPLLKFLSYFWGPIPWMIEVAVILSASGAALG